MSFVQEILNGISGNLATDLLKGMGRQISNTELVRKIGQRVNPEQLHAATRDLLAEALADVFADLPDGDSVGWKQIFAHPENRLQLIAWVLEWREDIDPDLGAWSLENAPNPDLLRGLLLRLHRIIQDKKRKHFPPDFFNLLSNQMEIRRNQMQTHEAIGDLERRLIELSKRPQMDEWNRIRGEIASCLAYYARWYGNIGSGHLNDMQKAYDALHQCASRLEQVMDCPIDRSLVKEAMQLLRGIANTLIDGDIRYRKLHPESKSDLETIQAHREQLRENRQNAEKVKGLLGLSQ